MFVLFLCIKPVSHTTTDPNSAVPTREMGLTSVTPIPAQTTVPTHPFRLVTGDSWGLTKSWDQITSWSAIKSVCLKNSNLRRQPFTICN